jgi:hypothetical protein
MVVSLPRFKKHHVGKTVEIVDGEKCDSQHVGNKVEIVHGEKCGRQLVKKRTFSSNVD